MATVVLYALLIANFFVALWRPWVGVVVGYIFVILGPQSIWFWAFEGVRPFYYVVLPTLAGLGIAALAGRVDLRPLKDRTSLCVLVLWVSVVISYMYGPYVSAYTGYRWSNVSVVFYNLNAIFLFYFVATVLLDDLNKLKWASVPILLATCYLIYWSNDMFLAGRWDGRLGGPTAPGGSSPYTDENAFAMLFVTGLPFLYYLGWYLRTWTLRILVWLIIPLGWHAVFLTGSRGGLVGLGVTVLIAAFRSPRKVFGFLAIPALVVAFWWQGGAVMQDRMTTVVDYQNESSAAGRLEAWDAGFRMMLEHPFTGVGVASFGAAFSDFSDKRPRVAHNTAVQIAAEWGVFGGCAFLLLVGFALRTLWRTSAAANQLMRGGGDPALYFLSEALLASLAGFLICGLFLSLESFEVFYYLLVLVATLGRITSGATTVALGPIMSDPAMGSRSDIIGVETASQAALTAEESRYSF